MVLPVPASPVSRRRPLRVLNSLCQAFKRLPGLAGEEQITGIGVDVKGVFAQSEKLVVHGRVVKSVAELSAV